MFKNKILVLLLIAANILFTGVANAQYVLKQARKEASLLNFTNAKLLYEKAYEKKNTIEAARALADIYMNNREFEFAESWYAKVIAMPAHTATDELHYAEVLMNNSKYDEASEQLRRYLSKNNDKKAENMLYGCGSAREWMTHPAKGSLENMQVFNTKYSDWGLVKTSDQYVFASDRPFSSGNKPRFFSNNNINADVYSWTGNSYLHLYKSAGNDSGQILDKTVNGDFHTASASFTANGREMYFAATDYVKKSRGFLRKEDPYTINVEILRSVWDSARQAWGEAEYFPFNKVFNYSLGDPCISPDGNTLYFTAAAGFGDGSTKGTDIYYSEKLGDTWQLPKSMGREINTDGNERTPFFDRNGNFYFASDGHIGMGGLDIFKAVKNAVGGWTVTNMGSPVNSPQDDFAPFFDSPLEMFFSSNRLAGKGNDDIYRFNIARELMLKVEGTVYDKDTRSPLSNAVVSLLNKNTGTPEKAITDENGHYSFKLDSLTDYEIGVSRTDYATITGLELTTKGVEESKTIRRDVGLMKAKVGTIIKLENIYFDLDKWDIRPDAVGDLNTVIKLMNDNPTWKIEMSSHTDSRGSDKYNMKLSQKRAESTVKYLIEHGISADRLVAKGYGETKLVNRCSNGVKCTEEEHQQNRRTEFTILDK